MAQAYMEQWAAMQKEKRDVTTNSRFHQLREAARAENKLAPDTIARIEETVKRYFVLHPEAERADLHYNSALRTLGVSADQLVAAEAQLARHFGVPVTCEKGSDYRESWVDITIG